MLANSKLDYNAQFNALFMLPDPLMVIDQDNILFVNEAMENLLGISSMVLCKETIQTRFGEGSDLVQLVHDVRGRRGRMVFDNRVSIQVNSGLYSGSQWDLNVSVVSLSQHNDNNDQMMVLVDRTSFISNTLAQQNRDEVIQSLNRVVSMIAHEVKNPLAGIRGAAQLLGGDEENNPMLSLIVRETDRIVRLIERLEKLDDAPDGAWERCNIHEILSDVITLARAGFGKHVTIFERYDPSLPDIWCNRDQMIQVFTNLIKNACEAVPEKGGIIHIKTNYDHLMRSGRKPIPITVHVIDNGRGISQKVMNKLFTPFVKDKVNGTGLGLAVVSKFVANHHGAINFKNNTPEPGATLTINLPKYDVTQDSLKQGA